MGTDIFVRPYSGFAHGCNEVRACEEHDSYISSLSILGHDSPELGIDFVIKVVKHDRSTLVVLVSFPSVDHEP